MSSKGLDMMDADALFHEAIPVFAQMKIRGVQLNLGKLNELDADVLDELDEVRRAMSGPEAKRFLKKYGRDFDSGKDADKRKLFLGLLGLKAFRTTNEKGNIDTPGDCSVDAESIRHLMTQVSENSSTYRLLEACIDEAHLIKLRGYVKNFRKMADPNGRLHPSFLLHIVSSFRSSSADPNWQNIPVRNPVLARIRRTIVPTYDYFMEMDFSGAEVRGYGVHTLDATLIDNIRNKVDFHRKYAGLLYEKPEDEITGEERFQGKNQFIFPEFYGSYHKSIAKKNPQWRARAVEKAEKILWDDMPDVKRWQEDTAEDYYKDGYIDYLTGFRIKYGKRGFLTFNQICNLPNQGFAFHRLLRILINVENEMRRRNMKSWICGQIHDSVVVDVVKEEAHDLMAIFETHVRKPCWGFDDVVPWEAEYKLGKNFVDSIEVETGVDLDDLDLRLIEKMGKALS